MAVKPKRKKKKTRKTSSTIFQDLAETKLARSLWSANKRVESARLFQSIVEKHPANIPALIDASRALGRLFDYARAMKYLDTVKEVGARSSRANFLAGQTYRLMKRIPQAIDCFNKSIELDPQNLEAHLELAILHERIGNLEQAKQHIQTRLHANRHDQEAIFLNSRLDRRLGENQQAKDQLFELTANESVFWMTKTRCYFELAKIFDQEEDYLEAWQAAKQGNELTRQHDALERERRGKLLPGLLQLADQLKDEHLRRWADQAGNETPNRTVLLSGLPRSGTTLLGNLLGSNAGAINADEFSVFGQLSYPLLLQNTSPQNISVDFLDSTNANHIRLVGSSYVSSFKSIFPDWSDEQWLIDKNPSLLPLLIPYLRTIPSGKVLVAQRDPRDTIVSCFMTYMPVNDFTVDKVELERAVTRFELEWNYWHCVRDVVPDTQQLEVKYERLVENPENELARCGRFLGFEPDSAINYPANVPAEAVHSPSYEEALQPVYDRAVGRWQNYLPALQPHLDRLDRLANKLGY